MDAVKAGIEEFGGDIEIRLLGKAIDGFVSFELLFRLPLDRLNIKSDYQASKAS